MDLGAQMAAARHNCRADHRAQVRVIGAPRIYIEKSSCWRLLPFEATRILICSIESGT